MVLLTETAIEGRIVQVLEHLGIARAHFAARSTPDYRGLAADHAGVVASLTLLCPESPEATVLGSLSDRLHAIVGDRGVMAESASRVVAGLPGATVTTLVDYETPVWADPAVDRGSETTQAMLGFLARQERLPLRLGSEGEGSVAGISYRVSGSGAPLVLLPLALSPSQWGPVVDELSQHYCVISLSGAHLGTMPMLEARGHAPGYLHMVENLVEAAGVGPGALVLDVGSGTGVLDRWLAHHTDSETRIVGVDASPYLVREARALVARDELDDEVEFREGDALALPFDDGTFEVTMSVTVMEEVDADRMLAEMVRVTRPGGRVAVIVRSVDLPWVVNLPVSSGLNAKLQAPGGNVAPGGCADESLYDRFHRAGLKGLRMAPYYVPFEDPRSEVTLVLRGRVSRLGGDDAAEAETAWQRAAEEGTFFFAQPHHCAVGTKPI